MPAAAAPAATTVAALACYSAAASAISTTNHDRTPAPSHDRPLPMLPFAHLQQQHKRHSRALLRRQLRVERNLAPDLQGLDAADIQDSAAQLH